MGNAGRKALRDIHDALPAELSAFQRSGDRTRDPHVQK
jgi:hypothetical protein